MRDIVGADADSIAVERIKISTLGWGTKLLSYQDSAGLWGGQLYSHKWLSTTYTLFLLRQMGLDPDHPQARAACRRLLEGGFEENGGISFAKSKAAYDNAVVGMVLSMLAYFGYPDSRVQVVAHFLIRQQKEDGRWEPYPENQVIKYTFDTTLLCLEGLWEYEKRYPEQSEQALAAQSKGREFLLRHRLYKEGPTGGIIHKNMLLFSFPPRWHYDVLAALDYFQMCKAERNDRLVDAIELLRRKQNKDGSWNLQNKHAGKTFFEMEAVGKPSKWNTLRALRVLSWWEGQ
jgi:hypothetical protein